jgi:hypothetical protein
MAALPPQALSETLTLLDAAVRSALGSLLAGAIAAETARRGSASSRGRLALAEPRRRRRLAGVSTPDASYEVYGRSFEGHSGLRKMLDGAQHRRAAPHRGVPAAVWARVPTDGEGGRDPRARRSGAHAATSPCGDRRSDPFVLVVRSRHRV